ncbi:hypothetical protein SCP_0804630 [Sparassis crispa]|uniref:Uncharacterized protein n=1 Tax=Sparassis crispa TaxID=139825 RepID=A0A401GUS3_9APHY|nr:hypothetical protein SCP_0804630 [Sparassis crispa]GBE85939.1 hypothetical protein SCP_0804630 [Sparassis crispa]
MQADECILFFAILAPPTFSPASASQPPEPAIHLIKMSNLSPMPLTDQIAGVLELMFHRKLHLATHAAHSAPSIEVPPSMPSALLLECNGIADALVKAIRNPVRLQWDIDRYCDSLSIQPTGQNEVLEAELERKWPPPFGESEIRIDQPATLVDMHGRILAWILPRVLIPDRQTKMLQATRALHPAIAASKPSSTTASWRHNPLYFLPPEECAQFSAGSLCLSPGWFQQVREHMESGRLETSASLKLEGGRSWLRDIHDSSALLGAILAVVHPTLYAAGRQCLGLIQQDPELREMALNWSSPFNALQVIANWETPFHRDSKTRYTFYDLLATLGNYTCAWLKFPAMRVAIDYSPGTVIAFCGKAIRHGVTRADGERLVYAYFMREGVQNRLGIPAPHWMQASYYASHIGMCTVHHRRDIMPKTDGDENTMQGMETVDGSFIGGIKLAEVMAKSQGVVITDGSIWLADLEVGGDGGEMCSVEKLRNKSRLVVDLDDEVEFVTKVAKQTTRGVRYVDVPLPMPTGSNVPSPSKSPSKAPALGSLFNLDDGDVLGNIGVPIQLDPAARKTKTQNDFMRDWIPHRDDYLHAIVEMEAPPEPRNCAECKVGEGRWRCLDCMGRALTCTDCCRNGHQRAPFHRIEHWQGQYFEPASLYRVGVCIHLGHGGDPCPLGAFTAHNNPAPVVAPGSDFWNASNEDLNAHDGEVSDDGEVPFNFAPLAGTLDGEARQTDDAPDPTWEEDVPPVLSRPPRCDSYGNRIIVIVDISGVHHIGVDWCQCEMAVECDMQLLQMGLYPGTVKDPHTAFTFAVLDDFLLENKECKMAALNYYSKLKRVTSNAFPGTVPDHYRELMRVSRQWRQLKYRKWHGFSHDALRPVEKGGLAIFCPACPQPGLNLPFDWQADPVQWKFKRGFVMDGNFSAEHMKMKHPEEDVALSDGQAFMVGQEDYKAHLAVAMESHQRSTCHEHRAVNQANVDRANLDATGIGATACARHGFFVPHTVVDFQKGERQMNMDYSLSNALLTLTGITLILVMYDIMCQYGVHVRKRFRHSAYLRMPFELKIDQGIGLFHVHGHQDCCFQRFSPNFIVGAGMVDGEVIETLWAPTNEVSGSTRGMTRAHRQEVLDDHMNDSNWKKTTRMVPTLMTKWKHVLLGFPRSKESFEALSASTDEEVLEAWQKEYDDAMEARQNDPKIMDTFDVQLRKAPGKDLTQLRLAGEESAKGLEKGTAGWLSTGLKIQEAQLKLANDICKAGQNPSMAEDLKTLERRQHLEVSILTFQCRSEKFMGRLEDVPAMEDRDDGALWDSLDENPFQIHPEDAEYDEDAIPPERASLNLPSQIRFVAAIANGLQTLAAQELELRKGLMNDILHELHMVLGLKSYLYRKRVRPANSVGTMTRAQAEVHAANQTVLACARLYSTNRRAIMRLGATDEDLALYRPLDKKDLHVKTAIIEASTSGLRNVNLAWFWTMDVAGDRGSSEWMDECS